MEVNRIWRWFIGVALLTALLPGLGVAIAMTSASLRGNAPGLWLLAATQSHAVALIMGWGGAMILGVAIHFLPRLRGVPVRWPKLLSLFFVLFGLGLAVRSTLQPLWAFGIERGMDPLNPWINRAMAGSIMAQAVGGCGLVGILIATFRAGRPLEKNKGFRQIVSLLAVAGFAFILTQGIWCLAALRAWMRGQSLVVLAAPLQGVAVDLMLFVCIPAICIAMASRLFPLTFRTQLPSALGLHLTAIFLFTGGILSAAVLAMTSSETTNWFTNWLSSLAAGCSAAGWLCGTYAVRIFHPRKPILKTQTRYRVWEDPAAIGVLGSFGWLAVAAFLLIGTLAAQQFAVLSPLSSNPNLVRHACGLGFMTLLIISVGWKMLPGFAGGQPRNAPWIWAAVALTHLATILRLVPLLFPSYALLGYVFRDVALPIAGLCALAAIIAFVIALTASFKKAIR